MIKDKKYDLVTIAIANISEAYIDYIKADPEHATYFAKQGYRAAMWRGERKVVVTSNPISNIEYLGHLLGFEYVETIVPNQPTNSLCVDILREKPLLERILIECSQSNKVEIIPYCTSQDFIYLMDVLSQELRHMGVEVILPESSCDKRSLWLWRYFDTKIGFRQLITEWFHNDNVISMPEGYIATSPNDAVSIANWFLSQGRDVICKSSVGVLGLGAVKIKSTSKPLSIDELECFLNQKLSPVLFPIIVEEFINSSSSPSIEVVIPKLGEGNIEVMYYCTQIFSNNGEFAGIKIGQKCVPEPVATQIIECSIQIAKELQNRGYVGILDVDFIVVADDGQIKLIEANLRRTGGTHVHETAIRLLGTDYWNDNIILGLNNITLNFPCDSIHLIRKVQPFLYPMKSQNEGLILASLDSLPVSVAIILIAKSDKSLKWFKKKFSPLGITLHD